MNKLLTNNQVELIANKKLPIISSAIIHKFNNLHELFNGYSDVLILYQDNHSNNMLSGHWCALKHIDNDNVAFFDSYGKFPDDQLNHIPKKYRRLTNQMYKYLSDLLYKSDYKNIHYNPYQLQESKKGINTCGRHVGLFILLDMDPEDYYKFMCYLKKKLKYKNFDLLVT